MTIEQMFASAFMQGGQWAKENAASSPDHADAASREFGKLASDWLAKYVHGLMSDGLNEALDLARARRNEGAHEGPASGDPLRDIL